MKQQIKSLSITKVKNDQVFYIVNDIDSAALLEKHLISSICLNGYSLEALISMLERSSKASEYVYMIATDNTLEGQQNALYLKQWFWDRQRKGLYSINYMPLRVSGHKSMVELVKEWSKIN